MAMGRPTLYNSEVISTICEQIATGKKTLAEICAPASMPKVTTVLRWLTESDKEEFRELYTRARLAQADVHADDVVGIIDMAVKRVDKLYNGTDPLKVLQAIDKAGDEAIQAARALCDNEAEWAAVDKAKIIKDARAQAMSAFAMASDVLPSRARAILDGARAQADQRKWHTSKMASHKYGPKVESLVVGDPSRPVMVQLVGAEAATPWMAEALNEEGALDGFTDEETSDFSDTGDGAR